MLNPLETDILDLYLEIQSAQRTHEEIFRINRELPTFQPGNPPFGAYLHETEKAERELTSVFNSAYTFREMLKGMRFDEIAPRYGPYHDNAQAHGKLLHAVTSHAQELADRCPIEIPLVRYVGGGMYQATCGLDFLARKLAERLARLKAA